MKKIIRKIFDQLLQRAARAREAGQILFPAEGKQIRFELSDLNLELSYRVTRGKFQKKEEEADLIVRLTAVRFYRLLTRRVSLEQLYFERYLELTGDFHVFLPLAALFS